MPRLKCIEQEYELLENCLPQPLDCRPLTEHIDTIVGLNGKLASHLYIQSKPPLSYDRIKALTRMGPDKHRNILELLRFLGGCPELLQQNELTPLLDSLTRHKQAYWSCYPNFYAIISACINLISLNPSSLNPCTPVLLKVISILNNPDLT
jgi:hypothetical protein